MADVLDVIEKWYPTEQAAILTQLQKYRLKESLFGRKIAVDSMKEMPAVTWWRTLGSSTPELQKLAVRALSKCPSTSPCETNWSAYDYVVNKKRNKLKIEKANKLVYLNANLRFLEKFQKVE